MGLVGLYLHTLKDGRIENQGTVIGVHGGHGLVQRFSFLDGDETDVVAIPIVALFDPQKCRLYGSSEQMKHAYRYRTEDES